MNIFGNSDTGLVRTSNQDFIYIDNEKGWFIVADGMGGHNGGETASSMAVETVKESLLTITDKNAEKKIKEAIKNANYKVYEKSLEEEKLFGMGTTVVLCKVTEEKLIIAHIGDSRAYMISEGKIRQLTKDHSVVQHLLDSGTITLEEAKIHPQRNMITRALGTEDKIKIDISEFSYKENDKILLCSDGLSSMVDDLDILNIIESSENEEEAVMNLTEKAKEAGGADNISVILARM